MGVILAAIGAIATAAASVVKGLAVAGLAIQGLKAIANALVGLAKALGLIKPETEVEDLGDKAIQSGYNPEDYDSYAEYVKAVEEFDDLDPEKSKTIPLEEKIKKGMELSAGSTIEKYKDFPIQEFCTLVGSNPEYFSEARIGEISKLMEADSQNIENINNYINGSEKDSAKLQKTVDTLVNVEKTVNPGLSDKEAYKNVMEVRK